MASAEQLQPADFSSGYAEELQGVVDPTGGYSRYIQEARRLLKAHTGSENRFLSPIEEYRLAGIMQYGRTAQAELATLDDSDSQQSPRSTLEQQARAGQFAKQKIVECNLVFAAYCARISMNLLPKVESEGSDDTASFAERKYGSGGVNNRGLRSLRSRYAVLDDRVQVANLALLEAASNFLPRRDDRDQPIPFRTYARYKIRRKLGLYASYIERPGWRIGSSVLEQISRAQKEPEAFAPEERERLALLNQGRYTIPLEEVTIGEVDDRSSEASHPLLSDVVPATTEADPTSVQAFMIMRARALHKMLGELAAAERRVIQLHYGADLTLKEVATRLDDSPERQRQLKEAALRKLRHPIRLQILKELMVEPAPLSPSPLVPSSIEGALNVRTTSRPEV
jgi:RNA polymerase sigma factor (sigma-70 family)